MIVAFLISEGKTENYQLIADGNKVIYSMQAKAIKEWKLCALLPNGRDPYWWGVSQALKMKAEQLGVNLAIYDAGSYHNLAKQKQQLTECRTKGADGYIIASISDTGLNHEISELLQDKKVVIDLINGIKHNKITSHSKVSFEGMSSLALSYILSTDNSQRISVGFLPGPKSSEWVVDAVNGLIKLAKQHPRIKLINMGYGATQSNIQAGLIRQFFDLQTVDYVISNAVGAKILTSLVELRGYDTKILAYYSNVDTLRLLKNRALEASVSDFPLLQAELAIDISVKVLEGKKYPSTISPEIKLLTYKNITKSDVKYTIGIEGVWFQKQQFSEQTNSVTHHDTSNEKKPY
ncbi:MAG: protein TorT [Colwellia sp.]|jgi:protein TorT